MILVWREILKSMNKEVFFTSSTCCLMLKLIFVRWNLFQLEGCYYIKFCGRKGLRMRIPYWRLCRVQRIGEHIHIVFDGYLESNTKDHRQKTLQAFKIDFNPNKKTEGCLFIECKKKTGICWVTWSPFILLLILMFTFAIMMQIP